MRSELWKNGEMELSFELQQEDNFYDFFKDKKPKKAISFTIEKKNGEKITVSIPHTMLRGFLYESLKFLDEIADGRRKK